jgi:hypothetical protein
MLMPTETCARDVDAPASSMTATNNDAKSDFPTALNFRLQRCRIELPKVDLR